MSAQQHTINGSDLSDEQIDRIAFAVFAKVKRFLDEREVMSIKETAEFIGRSERHVHNLITKEVLKVHRLENDSNPYLLRSEILKKIKES